MLLFRAPKFSLIQLVCLGFLAVLLPLSLIVIQANSAYQQLSNQAQASAREAVNYTRRAQELVNSALNMERLSHQYSVLQDAQLLKLLEQNLHNFSQLVAQPFNLFNTDKSQQQIEAWLQEQAQKPNLAPSKLSELVDLSDQLAAASSAKVDTHLQYLHEQLAQVQKKLTRYFFGLAGLALALILFFTWHLVKPLNLLKQRIQQLALNPATKLPTDLFLQRAPKEIIELHQQISWLEEQLAALDEQKSQFLRHISHELKTPLASICEASSLLNEQLLGTLNPKQLEVAQLLEDNSERLTHLIEQLLDFNLLKAEHQPHRTSFNLNTLIQKVIEPWQPLLTHRQQSLEQHHTNLTVQADAHLLARCLDNLISNALHYGDAQQAIHLSAGQDTAQFWIEVANAGPELSSTDQARLFEPFYQGQNTRLGSLKGSGLGLCLALDCMHAQDGKLSLQSSTPEQTIFRLEWPIPNL